MRKSFFAMMAVFMVFGLMGCATPGTEEPMKQEAMTAPAQPGPTIAVANPLVKMSKKVNVFITGTGFKPGQEVSILFTTLDGIEADIGYALKPPPKANKIGAWVTVWNASRYVKRKLIKPGTYIITAMDSDFNVLDYTPIVFYSDKKKKK